MSRFLTGLEQEVIVANPRKVRAIYANQRKSDELDAMMLARLGRVYPSLLHAVAHQGEEAGNDCEPLPASKPIIECANSRSEAETDCPEDSPKGERSEST